MHAQDEGLGAVGFALTSWLAFASLLHLNVQQTDLGRYLLPLSLISVVRGWWQLGEMLCRNTKAVNPCIFVHCCYREPSPAPPWVPGQPRCTRSKAAMCPLLFPDTGDKPRQWEQGQGCRGLLHGAAPTAVTEGGQRLCKAQPGAGG